jgi:hypothetical protein
LQRARGLKFTIQSGQLRSFVAFAEAAGDDRVRSSRVLDWAARTTSSMQARNKLSIVLRFAEALAIEDPAHEVPPQMPSGAGSSSDKCRTSTAPKRLPR